MDEGFINYIKVAFCDNPPKYVPLIEIGYGLWLLFLFVGLGTTAGGFFCPAVEFIAHNLKMHPHIAGLTIVALGNGAPDIFSAIAAFTNSNPSTAGVAIGALLGAAMLVTMVVAGLVATTKPFDIAKRPFLRDMTFFLAVAFWLFYQIYHGEINLTTSVGFLCLYVVYIAVVAIGRCINQRQRARLQILEKIINEDGGAISVSSTNKVTERTPLIPPPSVETVPPSNTNNNNADLDGDWTEGRVQPRRLDEEKRNSDVASDQALEGVENIISGLNSSSDTDLTEHSFLYILACGLNPIDNKKWKSSRFIFKLLMILQAPWKVVCKALIPIVQLNKPQRGWNRPLTSLSLLLAPPFCVFATKGGHVTLGTTFPLWALLLIIGFVLAVLIFFTSDNFKPPVYQWVFSYVGFIVAIIVTYTIANEIVNLVQTFGFFFNLSNVIMGLTFLTWGNSIPDIVADVTLARRGYPRISWSASFGGPLFNLLIGVGFPCTITILKNNGAPILVDYNVVEAVGFGGLFMSLCFTFITIPLLGFRLCPKFGYVLIVLYLLWLIVAVLAGVNMF
ncbi:mitochondrial sodium/calcium exchanger protein-like isoform X2 [Clavelina lepadiformis]